MNSKTLHQACLFVVGCCVTPVAVSQPKTPGNIAAAPLGLFRAKEATKPGQATPLAPAKFGVAELSVTGVAGATRVKKDGLDYIALDANRQWSSALRGNPRDPTYASFMVQGSQNTVIEVGGARLGLTASPMKNTLQLMFDDSATGTLQWKHLNVHIATGTYGGKPMAVLPVLTVALDPATSTWHLYYGSRLLADHLPLIAAKKDSRQFSVTAGNAGAWVCGLVLADENPLYVDDNFNGIDDAFEKTKRGGQLPPNGASVPERQLLAKQWKEAQRAKPPPALFVARPLPDGR